MPSVTASGESRPRPRRRRRWIWLGLALVAGGAASWTLWRLSHPPRPELEAGWAAVVSVLAGDGQTGVRDGDADRARFTDPFDVAFAPDGSVYVSDAGTSPRIRRITPDGRVSTVATGFQTPSGIAAAPDGTLYVADTGKNVIARIAPDGQVSTYAGSGLAGFQDGVALGGRFNGPVDVAVTPDGRVVVADTYNDRIRAITPSGFVTTIAGSGQPGFFDGRGEEASFDTPSGVAVDPAGNVFVADTGNDAVRMIAPDGTVTTLAGPFDGIVRPAGIAVSPNRDVFVTDDRGRIAHLPANGESRTLAGSAPGFRDGPGSEARFRRPSGIALAAPGRLIVADAGNATVRTIAALSRRDLRPPSSPLIAPDFDAVSFGLRPLLWPVAPMEGPFEIAGTLGEARGGEGSERFHAGIDIRVADGTLVHAVRDGIVASPVSTGEYGTLNEWLRIGPLTYVHIRAGRARRDVLLDPDRFVPTYDSAGKLVRIRVKRGARFRTGEPIASVNRFNHVHLNVGWPGEERNPLQFRLPHFTDTIPPTIARGGVRLYDDRAQPLKQRVRRRLLVSGSVSIVVDAWDQVNGNRPGRRLGLHSLGYQILRADGTPAAGFESPRETIRFDRIAVSADAARLVYASGSGIPFYGRRVTRFLYTVTNTFRDGIATEGFWDTTALAPGDYVVRIHAADIRGNTALANRDLPVTIVPAAQPAAPR